MSFQHAAKGGERASPIYIHMMRCTGFHSAFLSLPSYAHMYCMVVPYRKSKGVIFFLKFIDNYKCHLLPTKFYQLDFSIFLISNYAICRVLISEIVKVDKVASKKTKSRIQMYYELVRRTHSRERQEECTLWKYMCDIQGSIFTVYGVRNLEMTIRFSL